MELLSVTFNHDFLSARTSALNIRMNGRQFIEIPEWLAGRARQHPAAYAIEETAFARPFVVATFSGPPNSVAQVTAVPASPERRHVLGVLDPQNVQFDSNGLSGLVQFNLSNATFLSVGIGEHAVRWQWLQRSRPVDPWQEFAQTSHTIFTVLRTPRLPWVQSPFVAGNTQLPWAEALQLACSWAAFATTSAAAATAITFALFAQGGSRFKYSCVSGAPSNYSSPEFDCSAFLERVAGGFGRGPNVNCSDCATIVSTLANLLGGDLSQSQMFNSLTPFGVNPVRMIGQASFGPVCGTGLFNYHEVAWEGACTEIDEVYDACVALLVPPAPFIGVVAVVPAQMFFGWPNQGLYRDLLAKPTSRSICQPQPFASRRRRAVF